MRRHKRRLEEEEEGRKMGGKEGKGAEKKEVWEKRSVKCGGGTDWRRRMFKECV